LVTDRRAPTPYVEMKHLLYDGQSATCYVYYAKPIFSLLVVAIGLGLMTVGG
jgi:hypothetical protein